MLVTEPQGDIAAWMLPRIHYVPTPNIVFFGQYSPSKGRLVGAVAFDNWSSASVEMHCAGEPGWLSKELLYKAFYYPFILGNVNVVLARVGSDNAGALRFDKKLGFKEQCRIPKAWDAGQDLVILSMSREDCKWLYMDSLQSVEVPTNG